MALIRSGTPFSFGFTPTPVGWYSTRADFVGDPHIDNPTLQRSFKRAGFRLPAAFTFGNSARNLLFGPGQWKLDSGCTRIFSWVSAAVSRRSVQLPESSQLQQAVRQLSSPSTIGRISPNSVEQPPYSSRSG